MPHSLKCKVKNLNHKGLLTDRDTERIIKGLETVIKSEKEFEWCTGCKEYDQEAHCCHRYSKLINESVKEIRDILQEAYDEINDIPITYIEQDEKYPGGFYVRQKDAKTYKADVMAVMEKYLAEGVVNGYR